MKLQRDEKIPEFIGWDAEGRGYLTSKNGAAKSPTSPFKKVVDYLPIFDDDAETATVYFRVIDIDGKRRLLNSRTGELV